MKNSKTIVTHHRGRRRNSPLLKQVRYALLHLAKSPHLHAHDLRLACFLVANLVGLSPDESRRFNFNRLSNQYFFDPALIRTSLRFLYQHGLFQLRPDGLQLRSPLLWATAPPPLQKALRIAHAGHRDPKSPRTIFPPPDPPPVRFRKDPDPGLPNPTPGNNNKSPKK